MAPLLTPADLSRGQTALEREEGLHYTLDWPTSSYVFCHAFHRSDDVPDERSNFLPLPGEALHENNMVRIRQVTAPFVSSPGVRGSNPKGRGPQRYVLCKHSAHGVDIHTRTYRKPYEIRSTGLAEVDWDSRR